MKLKIKSGIPMDKMIAPYGVITKEWQDFPEGSYVYKELEVFGADQAPSSPTTPSPVVEPIAEELYPLKDNYAEELAAIPGIGRKTVLDIKKVYRTEEDLIRALRLTPDAIPLRDDYVARLRSYYKIR